MSAARENNVREKKKRIQFRSLRVNGCGKMAAGAKCGGKFNRICSLRSLTAFSFVTGQFIDFGFGTFGESVIYSEGHPGICIPLKVAWCRPHDLLHGRGKPFRRLIYKNILRLNASFGRIMVKGCSIELIKSYRLV